MTQEPPVKGMKTIPAGLPLMFDAWMGCVLWSARQAQIASAFTEATGFHLYSLEGRSAIDQMVDKATGYDVAVLAAFCDYVTKEIWGEEEPL